MIHFEFFYHLVRGSQAAEKIYFGHSSRKDNHPSPLPQQGFCTSLQIWDELGVAWQTKQSVFFLAILGASNFKHFKQLFMTLSGLSMWQLPRGVSYFVSSLLQNYFTCLSHNFWSSPSFPSFKTFISPPNSRFLAVSILADKPLNGSICCGSILSLVQIFFPFVSNSLSCYYHTLPYVKTKEKKIWTKDKIEPQHIHAYVLK